MRFGFGLGLVLILLTAPLAADEQPQAKVHRLGLLGSASPAGYAHLVEALRQGLRDLGYVEGKNLAVEYRWAEGKYDRLLDLAAELVRLKVDLIVTHGAPGSLAAKQATTTIPIVMAIVGDAVATGLVTSIARPGGNITGSTFFFPELSAKRVELLKEAVPRATRIAALTNRGNPGARPSLDAMEPVANSLKELQPVGVRGPDDFPDAFLADDFCPPCVGSRSRHSQSASDEAISISTSAAGLARSGRRSPPRTARTQRGGSTRASAPLEG
jgi:putative ABC transport system substrate-binding protein